MKLGLETRGKWTSNHDVSQDVYIYIYIYIFAKVKFQNLCIYIHICKSEVSKLIPLLMLYTYLILLFLVCYFEIVYVKNDSKTIYLRKYLLYDI